jgi:hypothetical protein
MRIYDCDAIRQLAVVYLARQAEGLDAVRRFARSYQRFHAGVPHDLVVLFKGYRATAELEQTRAIFSGLPHLAMGIDDSGFDIGAYFKAARQIDHPWVCFVNTYTEIAADGWLAALHRHASMPHVGVAGAMGSYESLGSSLMLTQEVRQQCRSNAVARDAQIAHYYSFMIYDADGRTVEADTPRRSSALTKVPRRLYRAYRNARHRVGVCLGISRNHVTLSQFPRFPNPHIRSNGFMMLRERLLGMNFPSPKSKWDAYAFESGPRSLTAQLRRDGLAAVVVDRKGHGYDVDQWCCSGTFRLGDQSNLLITDNQTRFYASMAPGHRATLARMTWGDYLGAAPEDFPTFGFEFGRVG